MRICLSGSGCVGKSTFVDDFIKTWPVYKRAERTYKKLANKKNFNKNGNKENQGLILDCLLDEAMKYTKTDFVIHDRGVLDNVVYSMWLYEKGTGDVDDAFIQKSIALAKQGLHFYDIILYFPILEKYPIAYVEQEGRETDPVYNQEIDNLFYAIQASYTKGDETLFEFSSPDGAPALIEVYGNREERIQMLKLYINEDGEPFGKKSSDTLIQLPSLEEQVMLDKIIAQSRL